MISSGIHCLLVTKHQNITVSVVCFIIAVSLIAWYFLRPNKPQIISINQPVEIDTEQALVSKNLSIKSTDSEKLNQLFNETKLIDGNKVTSVDIEFTDTPNPQATYIRSDVPNQILLSSNYVRVGKKVVITLYASPELKAMLPSKQADLLNFYFWEVADLIAISNLDGGMNPKNHQPVFTPL